MNIVDHPSPNFDSRDGQAIDMLVLHYTNMPTMLEARERLCDPAARVSAHYLIDEEGTIYRLVAEEMRAWHAGVSYWRENTNINQRSIGIELVNPGHSWGYRPFPEVQMQALVELCQGILQRHAIPPRNVVGHSDICPTREDKIDPGILFDWPWMAGQGIGLWPQDKASGGRDWGLEKEIRLMPDAQSLIPLKQYGYDITDLSKAILAFQRHFFPQRLTGVWDRECALRLASLLSMV